MMKITSAALIEDLVERTRQNINKAQSYKNLTLNELNFKPSPQSWSALECLLHLNLYGDFYIPEIKLRLKNNSYPSTLLFKSGLLGNYFAKMMLPREKLNKMKTFKDKSPSGGHLDFLVLERFLNQQEQLLQLLNSARKTNLSKVKTNISISKYLKLKLGDTFRVIIYHNQRHLVQADKSIAKAKSQS